MKHVVFFSSGVASYITALRVVERYGAENTTLVFADTLIEDEDNYRFLIEAAEDVGAELVHLKDGRDPWQVFDDEKHLGTSRFAFCSKALKIDTSRKYLESLDHMPTLHMGIDWTEEHRKPAITKGWHPYEVDYPLCWEPWLDRANYFEICEERGIKPPRLYELGFSHANCGGFCVKAGHTAFLHLLKTFPERYAYHEEQEAKWREKYRDTIAILRSRGVASPDH